MPDIIELAEQNPQVAMLLAQNNKLRDAAGSVALDLELICDSLVRTQASTAKALLNEAGKLREACK